MSVGVYALYTSRDVYALSRCVESVYTPIHSQLNMQNKRVRQSYAQILEQDGVVVVPVFQEDMSDISKAFQSIVWPEFKDQTPPLVLGGFGAFGHASSFHHPFVRNIRMRVKQRLAETVFREYAPTYHLESMFDRVCERNVKYGTILNVIYISSIVVLNKRYA